MVPHALKLFEQIRSSGRSQRPRLSAILDGTGFAATEVAEALVRAKLMVARRGQGGGYSTLRSSGADGEARRCAAHS